MTSRSSRPFPARSVLVRTTTIGDFDAPAPRPPLVSGGIRRWAKWGLLPVSSIMRVATHEPVISLTYDDGPDPVETPALLDVLAARGVRATFFVLSDRVRAHPDIVRRMLADGHEVELHGDDHTDLTTVPVKEAVQRIRRARAAVEQITGHRIRYFRPTFGAVNLATFLGVRALGMDVVIWSAWAEDWFEASAEEIADRAVRALHPGAVVLLHDTNDPVQTPEGTIQPTFSRAEAADRILEGASASGFGTLPLGQLLDRYPLVRSLTFRPPRLRLRGN